MTLIAIAALAECNTRPLLRAFERIAVPAVATLDAGLLEDVSHIVLPGVGAFGSAKRALDDAGFRVPTDRPVLGICLGMHLLCEGSEEAPGVAGYGRLPGVARAAPYVRIGWERLMGPEAAVRDAAYYFCHGYHVVSGPVYRSVDHWRVHGSESVAMACEGNAIGVQFHPERSGKAGLAFLRRWVETNPSNHEPRRWVP